MKVLVIGSGGREHTLVWKISQSEKVSKIYAAPGNGGIAELAECVDIQANDIPGLVKFALTNQIELTVVGPEAPLVEGVVDAFQDNDLRIFGPRKNAAQLEGSKVFAKEFMTRWAIPTAEYGAFSDIESAKEYLEDAAVPCVVKADGLAAGKGVIICQTKEEALAALDQIMVEKSFQEAGNEVVIEEFLEGEEASILAISDGRRFIVLETSQDHKRIFDNDEGPNTGGMGAYSPAPVVTPELYEKIVRTVIEPTIKGMNNEGTPFVGVLYAGLMIGKKEINVLEYNVRLGDPETQVVLPRLKNDLVEVMEAAIDGELEFIELSSDPRVCVCVVVSAGGYPGDYEKGYEITGLDTVTEGITTVFHAGTEKKDNKIVSSGGRVLGISSFGDSIEDAIKNVYKDVSKITFKDCFYRKDIGQKALK